MSKRTGLTQKQLLKLNDMVSNYRKGLRRTLKVSEDLIDAYSARYKVAMTEHFRNQNK